MYLNLPPTPPYNKPTVLEDDTLYVVTSHFNSARYNSRIRLYKEFEAYIATIPGAKLVTVEVAYGDRPFEVTQPNDPFDVQLRAKDALFHKERAINIAVSRLPQNWRYVCWLDSDISFSRPDWAVECVNELQHWPVCQLYRECLDLGAADEILKTNYSFAYCVQEKLEGLGKYGGTRRHPGFGIAYTREAWRTMGGLLDIAIVGSGDYYMCNGLMGTLEQVIPKGVTKDYRDRLMDWQDDAKKLRGLFGYLRATIFHKYHGQKANRNYTNRNLFLIHSQFTPSVDLIPNEWLLWQIDEDKPKLKADIDIYLRSRMEDSL